jgi:hypothetical protein
MPSVQRIENCFNELSFISSPWNYQGNTFGKVAAWAGFFFGGWVYHTCHAVYYVVNRIYQWLISEFKVTNFVKENIFRDRIAQTLASFNNRRVSGQINGIYLTTNETNLESVRQILRNYPSNTLRRIHIGCASWHNLDIMCARRSTYGLIVDFNPKNAEFMRKTMELVSVCPSRHAFKEAMINYLNSLRGTERDLFFHRDQLGTPIDRIERELNREGSWLQSEENYLYVKSQLASQGRLIAITEDITNFEKFTLIRRFLDSNNIAIDTVYLSNICNFMRTPTERNSFVRSIRQLLHDNTILINCPRLRRASNTIILEQRPLLGRGILASSYHPAQLFEVEGG